MKISEKKKILLNESYLSLRVGPKKRVGPHIDPKHSPIEPKKAQITPEIQTNKKFRKQKIFKMKVISHKKVSN